VEGATIVREDDWNEEAGGEQKEVQSSQSDDEEGKVGSGGMVGWGKPWI